MSEELRPHILIVEARFYDDIADNLVSSARAEIETAGGIVERLSVPGVFEIPAAIQFALDAQEMGLKRIDGVVALGCVIRGETSHYDVVAGESARALMDISLAYSLPLGNGILTVENRDQAAVRADKAQKDYGGKAARACMAMVNLRNRLGQATH